MADQSKPISELRVNIDCNEMIKGLKAVQRAARKATVDLTALRNAMADPRIKPESLSLSVEDVKSVTEMVSHN